MILVGSSSIGGGHSPGFHSAQPRVLYQKPPTMVGGQLSTVESGQGDGHGESLVFMSTFWRPCWSSEHVSSSRQSSSSSSPGSDRQLHRSFLSGPNGRDQIPLAQLVSLGDHSIVPRQVHHASNCSFSGGIQIVPLSIHSSRQPGQISGVVSRPGYNHPSLSFVGEPMGRSVRDKHQHEGSCLLQLNLGTPDLSG